MDLQTIIGLVRQAPQVQEAVDQIERQLARNPIVSEDLDPIIAMLEAVVQDPRRYPEVRAAAIKDRVISEQEAPQEYDPMFVFAVLVALYEYRDRLSKEGYARGGLRVAARKLQSAGRGGDSMLAHINPREAEMLQRMGGAGTVNPNTGLQEYKGGGSILGTILPIALNFLVPGIGGIVGSAMGATGVAADVLGSAVIGGLSSAVSGGNPLKGAIMGGLGAGIGPIVGETAGNALGLNLGSTGQSILGGALVGGASGALTGQGFGKGAAMGALGSGLGAATQGLTEGALGAGIGSAGQSVGNMLAAGFSPKEALATGALSGLAGGLSYQPPLPQQPFSGQGMKPSTAVLEGLKAPTATPTALDLGAYKQNLLTGQMGYQPGVGAGSVDYSNLFNQAASVDGQGLQASADVLKTGLPAIQSTTSPTAVTKAGPLSDLLNVKSLGALALLGSMSGQRPPEVNQALGKLSPAQQEYFNRPSVKWDWNKLQGDAAAQNMSLGQYMATYWPQVTSGAYNMAAGGGIGAMGGGPLGAVARLARGSGSGRDDTINARLSDGEYVMDAETVAMIGDGSTDEGARRLDAMRQQIRKHKGKALARGRFSPDAKSPLAYLKGAA